MATLITHIALPLIARIAIAPTHALPKSIDRRCFAAAVIGSCIPDIDALGPLFDAREPSLFAARGFSHSLVFAAIFTLIVAALFFRSASTRARSIAIAIVFASTASHGIVDAMSVGDVGVAFFAPFSSTRFFLPLRVIAACPNAPPEHIGAWIKLLAANELLFILAPAFLIAFTIRVWITSRVADRRKRVLVAFLCVDWIVIAWFCRTEDPDLFQLVHPRPMMAIDADENQRLSLIPRGPLPDHFLVTSYEDLKILGYFNRDLVPNESLWSSSFFPWWYGGEAGRWQDGRLPLIGRTLFGASTLGEQEIDGWIRAADAGDLHSRDRLFRLSPTEKLDLVFGDRSFSFTRATLARTHNGSPKFWFGRCNGIATASMYHPEPYRTVDVTGVDGHVTRFHPNDIKSLLAVAYSTMKGSVTLGGTCTSSAFDAALGCSMNPASLVIATLNWIGAAHQTFLVDALPNVAIQYYAVARAKVSITRSPYMKPPRAQKLTLAEEAFDHTVAAWLDVTIELTLASTTLPDSEANVKVDETHYAKVGLRPVVKTYRATLALDATSSLIGGKWKDDPADGPDAIAFVTSDIATSADGSMLASPEVLPLPILLELARVSAAGDDVPATIDARTFNHSSR
jgi:inner membrane protein